MKFLNNIQSIIKLKVFIIIYANLHALTNAMNVSIKYMQL